MALYATINVRQQDREGIPAPACTQPLVATLMGCVFLGEPLTLVRVTGMALVGGSMLVASIPWDKRKTPAGLGRAGV